MHLNKLWITLYRWLLFWFSFRWKWLGLYGCIFWLLFSSWLGRCWKFRLFLSTFTLFYNFLTLSRLSLLYNLAHRSTLFDNRRLYLTLSFLLLFDNLSYSITFLNCTFRQSRLCWGCLSCYRPFLFILIFIAILVITDVQRDFSLRVQRSFYSSCRCLRPCQLH